MKVNKKKLPVSQSAINKVLDALPVPRKCRYCGGIVSLIDNAAIYGRSYGYWHYAYKCDDCDSYVGIHNKTLIPLGTLANAKLRELRVTHKRHLHLLYTSGVYTRRATYAELARRMNIPIARCHFGMFDDEECIVAGAVIDQMIKEVGIKKPK